MISFDKTEQIFKLDTKNTSYIIGIYDQNYLLHLYYGAKIPDCTNLFFNARRPMSASFSPSNPSVSDQSFSVDAAPMEYSCNGSGDFRISALSVKNGDGNRRQKQKKPECRDCLRLKLTRYIFYIHRFL